MQTLLNLPNNPLSAIKGAKNEEEDTRDLFVFAGKLALFNVVDNTC